MEAPKNSNAKVRCRCECGREAIVYTRNVLFNSSTQCKSCSQRKAKTVHGEADESDLYRVWKAMKWRCNPRNKSQRKDYVDRGIFVCQEWAESYVVFRVWAESSGYRKGLTLDRRDNNSGYRPDNCRWITQKEQCWNTRRNKYVTAFGETKLLLEWLKDPRCSIKESTLRQRLVRGSSPENAITRPVNYHLRNLRTSSNKLS